MPIVNATIALVLLAACSNSSPKAPWETRPGTPHESFFRLGAGVQTTRFSAMSRREQLEIALEGLRREPPAEKWLRQFACEGEDSWITLPEAAAQAGDPDVGYIINALRVAPRPRDERTASTAVELLRQRTARIANRVFREHAVAALEQLTSEPKVLLDCSQLDALPGHQ